MPLFHFYTDYEPSEQQARLRQQVAKATWATQFWTEIPIRDQELPRLWEEEGRKFPFVLDLFDFACNGKSDRDILIYTNADIAVLSTSALRVAEALQEIEACYSYRLDMHHGSPAVLPDEVVLKSAVGYAGSDLYGFRARWWRKFRKEMPDMIIAFEAWDAVLRHLIEFSQPAKSVNLPNTHYHWKHGSFWENPLNRYRLKGQKRCLNLASDWLRRHGINPSRHGIHT